MAKLHLSLAIGENPRSLPILGGEVPVEGIDLYCTRLRAPELFWRQLEYQEFDVSELSMSSLIMMLAKGDTTWVALPIFTSRSFFHISTVVRKDLGVEAPVELKGARVGVREYQQTAAVWTRGVLEHEFGLRPADLHWFMERTAERSHGGAVGFRPPPDLDFHYIPESSSIGEMLLAGELDCAISYSSRPSLVDRSTADLSGVPELTTLFGDPKAEASRYYAKTGLFPINHCVVVRRSILERHPWVALNIFDAFSTAKAVARRQAKALNEPFIMSGLVDPVMAGRLDTDLFGYGVQSQKDVLETLTQYSYEQGLTPRRLELQEIFHPATLEV